MRWLRRALGDLLGPHEDAGPHRLRAGIAAPHATGEDRHGEQAEGGDHQQPGEQREVLRPEGDGEDVELARGQVEPDGLLAVPVDPRRGEIQDQQRPAGVEAQPLEKALDLAGVDVLALLVEVELADLRRRCHLDYRDPFFRHCRTARMDEKKAPAGPARFGQGRRAPARARGILTDSTGRRRRPSAGGSCPRSAARRRRASCRCDPCAARA